MPEPRILRPDDDASLRDWQHVHDATIPTHHLSPDQVRERARRHRLEVGYLGDVPVGCSTLRPPTDETLTVTLIARVIETVVPASNEDGLRCASKHGFVETDRYLLPGESVPWIDLRITASG